MQRRPTITLKTSSTMNMVSVIDQLIAGQAKLRHGDLKFLFENNEPFPLFPGEIMKGTHPLRVVKFVWKLYSTVRQNSALRLRATRDFIDRLDPKGPIERTLFFPLIPGKAASEWLFYGPATYFPQVAVEEVEEIKAVIIGPNSALRLRAVRDFTDSDNLQRKGFNDKVDQTDSSQRRVARSHYRSLSSQRSRKSCESGERRCKEFV